MLGIWGLGFQRVQPIMNRIGAKFEGSPAEASCPVAGHTDREPCQTLQCEGCSEQQVMLSRGSLRFPIV